MADEGSAAIATAASSSVLTGLPPSGPPPLPAPPTNWPAVAVLIAGQLRVFDRFRQRLDHLFDDGVNFDAFISTDGPSLLCGWNASWFGRGYIRWVGETPEVMLAAMRLVFSRIPRQHTTHLVQWWRLRDAWNRMERHESFRRTGYEYVVRLRSDLRLPRPLPTTWKDELIGRQLRLVMRGDWIFWGRREAMRIALEYVDALPQFHALGQRSYLPLPWRHMLAAASGSQNGLAAGMVTWFRYPLHNETLRPFGFTIYDAAFPNAIVKHIRSHLHALEARDADPNTRLAPSEVFSIRDSWWKWDFAGPDNEKYFMYHILNRTLFPRIMLDLYNENATADNGGVIGFTKGNNTLLLPERHGSLCEGVASRPAPRATSLAKPWAKLNENERAAATTLGHTQASWTNQATKAKAVSGVGMQSRPGPRSRPLSQ